MSDSSGRTDGQLRTPETSPPRAHHSDSWAPPGDEISLFDIWDALVRRQWLIAAVFVGVSVLAAGYAITRPDVYHYQTSLQIGHTIIETAERPQREPIAAPEAVMAKLEASLIPSALRSVLGLDEEQLAAGGDSTPNVEVHAPSKANILHLRIEGRAEKAAQYLEILRTAANSVVRDHAGVLDSERIYLTERRARLEGQRERVASQLQEVEARLDRLAAAHGTDKTFRALRIDGLQQRSGTLQDRLLGIEDDAAEVTDDLAALDEVADAFSGRLTPQSIDRQQDARNRLAAVGGGIRPTSVVAAPERSLTRAGTSGKLIVSLGLVLGAMLGVLSGLAAEFISAARQRRGGTGESKSVIVASRTADPPTNNNIEPSSGRE